MKARYLGHSTVELHLDGIKVLLDPFISQNSLAKDIEIDEIKPDYIFLSHSHSDHVADMAKIQKSSDAEVVSIVETAAWVEKQGVPSERIIGMNFGGTVITKFGSAKMVYALHTNATPDGEYGGVAAGYVFRSNNKSIYFAGDTALTLEMQLLADEKLDWAFLPIGDFYTMGVDDAIRAAQFINCKNIIGIHYNTFPPIRIDTEKAIQKFKKSGLKLHLLKIGETIDLY